MKIDFLSFLSILPNGIDFKVFLPDPREDFIDKLVFQSRTGVFMGRCPYLSNHVNYIRIPNGKLEIYLELSMNI